MPINLNSWQLWDKRRHTRRCSAWILWRNLSANAHFFTLLSKILGLTGQSENLWGLGTGSVFDRQKRINGYPLMFSNSYPWAVEKSVQKSWIAAPIGTRFADLPGLTNKGGPRWRYDSDSFGACNRQRGFLPDGCASHPGDLCLVSVPFSSNDRFRKEIGRTLKGNQRLRLAKLALNAKLMTVGKE